ncbi:MAG: tetratricopeptide repeat protein [Gemmatimonadaceae bacterium]
MTNNTAHRRAATERCAPTPAILWALIGAALLAPLGAIHAQGLSVKEALAGAGSTGCAAFPIPAVANAPAAAATDAEARQLISQGQDAALLGEHAAARDAFAKALALTPANARLSYYLGREHEALSDASAAVAAYCRYLALQPSAPDGDEVRGRVVRLVPSTELARMDEARTTFRSGVALLERRQYTAADSAFASVAQVLPSAPEPYFNRGLARAARGNRQPALEDFEKYLELAPVAPDRGEVRNAMSRIPDGVFSPRASFGSGLLIPGLGQMGTGRPILGVMVLGAVGGAGVFGLQTKQTVDARTFTDPFGTSYVDSIPKTTRPNFAIAAAAAGVLWLGSAFEAAAYARRSRRKAEAIITRTPAAKEERRVSVRLVSTPNGVAVALGW